MIERALLLLLALLVVGGCVLEPRDLEGFPCAAPEECITERGYRCVDAVCVFDPEGRLDAGPDPVIADDAGSTDAGD